MDARTEDRLEAVGRTGYAVSGVLHLLIGVIAVQVALGTGSGSADQDGALASIAAQPFGRVLLWVAVLALAALGLWQLVQAVGAVNRGRGDAGGGHRDAGAAAKSAGKGVVYLVLAGTAVTFATGSGGGGGSASTDVTASLLGSTAGTAVVGAVGLAIIAVGVYHVWSGATEHFLEGLRGLPPGRAGHGTRVLGRVGYIAKGIALAVLGGLFVLAAVNSDPSRAGGLDQALRTLGGQPFGQVLLIGVGAGFVAYGVYSIVRARYAST